MTQVGDAVHVNTPDNLRLHNSRARVARIAYATQGEPNTSVYHLDAPAAATGKFRALAHEIIPVDDDDECRTLKEISGVARKVTVTGDPTGDVCPVCGFLLVQTGKCKTCQAGCGFDTGGCS